MQKLTTAELLRETLTGIVKDIKAEAERDTEYLIDSAFYRFVEELGGLQMYIPRNSAIENRKRLITKEFKGNNILELSRKYNLSFVRIYQILKE